MACGTTADRLDWKVRERVRHFRLSGSYRRGELVLGLLTHRAVGALSISLGKMKLPSTCVAILAATLLMGWSDAFNSPSAKTSTHRILPSRSSSNFLQAQPTAVEEESTASTAADGSIPFQSRGKVNEIDFCMAPSDVSLSRSYGASSSSSSSSGTTTEAEVEVQAVAATTTSAAASAADASGRRVLSLTRSLNNASNRAVRRILLSRSWPSAEALNLSLRQVLAKEKELSGDLSSAASDVVAAAGTGVEAAVVESTSKCPVPRPILNIIMRRKDDGGTSIGLKEKAVVRKGGEEDANRNANEEDTPIPRSSKRGRTDEEWVAEQLDIFRESYEALPGYQYADAYLECILNLATSGVESPRVAEVLAAGVYDEAYMRVLSVLKSVGVVFENESDSGDPPRKRIASKLVDKDICLSMMDKLIIAKEKKGILPSPTDAVRFSSKSDTDKSGIEQESSGNTTVNDGDEDLAEIMQESTEDKEEEKAEHVETKAVKKVPKKGLKKLMFWVKEREAENEAVEMTEIISEQADTTEEIEAPTTDGNNADVTAEEEIQITPEDLGAVLLSAKEPTMTRQLNVLSNIVQRALLFGGDQELLVLSETLEADKPAFIQRWYPNAGGDGIVQPGVQYFTSLVKLLKSCYENGVQADLDPPVSLSPSYANAYERLIASCIELGSGYIKPVSSKNALPKTAKEELGRFAKWETSIRQTSPDISSYPEDMVGTWQVKDEIGGKTIGVSNVVFKPEGQVVVKPPLQGLRWRLDPGPTHLDTCTFQVLSDDGAILQYRGFVDRGARLEARFSNRSIKIRGGVSFLMRDGDVTLLGDDYAKDVLPINYQAGTTRFVMSKVFDVA